MCVQRRSHIGIAMQVAGVGTAAFFPERGQIADEAKALCLSCPVSAECRGYAVSNLRLVGLWGGTATRVRERIRASKLPGCAITCK